MLESNCKKAKDMFLDYLKNESNLKCNFNIIEKYKDDTDLDFLYSILDLTSDKKIDDLERPQYYVFKSFEGIIRKKLYAGELDCVIGIIKSIEHYIETAKYDEANYYKGYVSNFYNIIFEYYK